MKHRLVALAMLATVASAAVRAETTIYRCGNEYSNVACAHATAIVVAGAVTPEQRAEARDVARREKMLAAEMTRDRREQEALAKPAQAASLSAPRAPAPPAAGGKKHAKKHDKKAAIDEERDFVAAVPKAKKPGS